MILREGDLWHYVEEDGIGPLWKGHTFPAVACISGWSMINRKTAVIPDIATDERIPQELCANTFAMAPVRAEQPISAIGAYWSQRYSPADWEIDTLDALAEATAAAFENAEFMEAITKPRIKSDIRQLLSQRGYFSVSGKLRPFRPCSSTA